MKISNLLIILVFIACTTFIIDSCNRELPVAYFSASSLKCVVVKYQGKRFPCSSIINGKFERYNKIWIK